MSCERFDVGVLVIVQNVGFTFDEETAIIEENCGQGVFSIRLKGDRTIIVSSERNEIRLKK